MTNQHIAIVALLLTVSNLCFMLYRAGIATADDERERREQWAKDLARWKHVTEIHGGYLVNPDPHNARPGDISLWWIDEASFLPDQTN